MKKIYAVLLTVGVVYTQVTTPIVGDYFSSFRFASTVGLLEDDLDIMLDPGRLGEVKRHRLYTALANFATLSDRAFDNFSEGYFMFGGKGDFILGSGGLLYSHYLLKTPGIIQFDPEGPIYLGHIDTTTITNTDEDGNGSFDHTTTEKISAEHYTTTKENNWFIGFGKSFGGTNAGLFFLRTGQDTTNLPWGGPTNPYGNFTYSIERKDIINNITEYTENWTGTYEDKAGTGGNLFGLSFWSSISQNLFFNFMGGLGIISQTFSIQGNTQGRTDYNPGGDLDDFRTESYNINDIIEPSGTRYFLRFAAKSQWNPVNETWLYLVFQSQRLPEKTGTYSTIETVYRETDLGTGTEFFADTNTTSGIKTRSSGFKEFDLFLRNITQLGEKVIFAIGFGFNSNASDLTEKFNEDFYSAEVYDDGDNEPLDPDDYTETATKSTDWEELSSSSNNNIYLPVALEFLITNSLKFRLGASGFFSYAEQTNTKNPISSTPLITTRIEGDGDTTIIVDSPLEDGGSSETQNFNNSGIFYTFGLGYNVSENLQIDLMGFTNLTDLSGWRVSAVLKFY